jgi:type VI secretion system protein ImpL
VLFEIEVGNLVLAKKYTGYYAFAEFLKDFRKGQKTFYPGHFPEHEAQLKRLGIKYIKAKYQFNGHSAAVALLDSAPGRAPRNIVSCWDQ